jgi:catechol 2,3-dioxygenase-like lactoylglutathione lyase family enzyme
MMGFVATANADAARAFYHGTLGLPIISDDKFAIVFNAQGVPLRVQLVSKAVVAPYTVLGWEVADIHATVAALSSAGVKFERYPNFEQDEAGIWTAPNGKHVAWFKDPEGHTLSVSTPMPSAH